MAVLQRRYDHVLRRLDGGDGTPPAYPVHSYNPALAPQQCVEAVLHELAGARLTDRAETLAHGLQAVRELVAQREEARAWARGYEHGLFTVDTDEPPGWLTAQLGLDDDR